MSQYVYGIATNAGEHIDVSHSERGAKKYATNNGYTVVTKRSVSGYHVMTIATKENGKWVSSN